jgi:hypothetical protein
MNTVLPEEVWLKASAPSPIQSQSPTTPCPGHQNDGWQGVNSKQILKLCRQQGHTSEDKVHSSYMRNSTWNKCNKCLNVEGDYVEK